MASKRRSNSEARTAWWLPACGAALALLAGCQSAPERAGEVYAGAPDVARTGKPFANDPDDFQFVVIGDRTGGHRPGVFERALQQVEGLRPEFVINVGDLIEGYIEDRAEVLRQWEEIRPSIDGLSMPFFYVPGNHDLSNETMRAVWHERYGADFYHFVYRDVLFIVLNTEDPPQPEKSRMQLYRQYGAEPMMKVLRALQGDPSAAKTLFASDPLLAELAAKIMASEQANFSPGQIESVRRALAENPKARWTFLLMHRPAWRLESPAFREIESLLQGRPFTALAGHFHKYQYESRGGRDYIQLGTVGGTLGTTFGDPAGVDHVMWVTMTDAGPRITNIRLDGMFDRHGPAKPKP